MPRLVDSERKCIDMNRYGPNGLLVASATLASLSLVFSEIGYPDLVGVFLFFGAMVFISIWGLEALRPRKELVLSFELMAKVIADIRDFDAGMKTGPVGIGEKNELFQTLKPILAVLAVIAVVPVVIEAYNLTGRPFDRAPVVGAAIFLYGPFSLVFIIAIRVFRGAGPKTPSSYNLAHRWARGFLDAVDEGRVDSWMRAQAIMGDRWTRLFKEQDVIEVRESDGARIYVRTEFGKKLHEALRRP